MKINDYDHYKTKIIVNKHLIWVSFFYFFFEVNHFDFVQSNIFKNKFLVLNVHKITLVTSQYSSSKKNYKNKKADTFKTLTGTLKSPGT